MKRAELVRYLDELLGTAGIEDVSQNGLQVEGAVAVTRVAFAVDACAEAFARAAEAGAQMLIVHHGLFWGKPLLPAGVHGQRIRRLMQSDLNLYASHLPLDCHPALGNNAQLAKLLGLKKTRPFGVYHKVVLGVAGTLPFALPLEALAELLQEATGEPVQRVLDFGAKTVRRVGCVSGGAADMIDQAHEAGLDVFITGETRHSSYHDAAERRFNVIFGGHYATETAGLNALARHLETKLKLQTVFIDLPTGW